MQDTEQPRVKRAPNRFERRAHAAEKVSADRREARHWCILDARAELAGVAGPVGLSLSEWHDVHKALGEAFCPRCSRCTATKRHPVLMGRQEALKRWAAALEQTREREAVAKIHSTQADELELEKLASANPNLRAIQRELDQETDS